jgi:cell division protein FtsB
MTMKTTNIITDIVKLNIDEDISDLPSEVLAAISKNPTLKWIKFVLTDDAPNANKQRIPKEEFSNLVQTGIHMPIKMSQGYIREGHEYAVPIGSITSLIERDRFVEGIAGLWAKEYPGEIGLLGDMAGTEEKPQLSWEILYGDSAIDDEGIETFSDTSLAAATVVGTPAYEGRTPITLMASKNVSDADYKIKTEEYDKMEDQLKALQDRVDVLDSEKKTLEDSVDTLTEANETLQGEFDTLSTEKEELSTFKDEIDATVEREEKLEALVKLFSESGVDLPEDYLEDETRREKLLAMDLSQLEFLMQDLSIFASSDGNEDGEPNEEEASKKHLGSKITLNPKGKRAKEMTPSEIAKAMRDEKKEE